MLTIVFKILSIIGMLFLILLLLALAALLFLLFAPITYRVSGAKDGESFRVSGKVKWLLGLVRFRYEYPEPGELVAKVLFFTLFKAKIPPEEGGGAETEGTDKKIKFFGKKDRKTKASAEKKEDAAKTKECAEKKEDNSKTNECAGNDNMEEGLSMEEVLSIEESTEEGQAMEDGQPKENGENTDSDDADANGGASLSFFGKILQKIEKLKYTIHNIYDKIKEIWDNISYYLDLLQEEETRQLFSHIWLHVGGILKNIRPRRLRAQILFGTGSPDTTGYLYGVYCMIAPFLGGDVNVTPDFEESILQADFFLSGHITIWTLAVHAGRIALDKRLRKLIRKMKAPAAKTVKKEAEHENAA